MNFRNAVMDLPAQQHHINACLDSSPFKDCRLHSAARVASSPANAVSLGFRDWLESLGLTCYLNKFKAVRKSI